MSSGHGSEAAVLAKSPIRQGRPNPFPANMTAFLKIDSCDTCHRAQPWEWVPAVLLNGKPLAGTGIWRSQLIERRCPACQAALEAQRHNEQRSTQLRRELIRLLGGEKAYREFTFEHYKLMPGNRLAYERCKRFDPTTENFYLWGPCGAGKTHLAHATARRCFEESLSVAMIRAYQLSRKIRMRGPDQEQQAIDELVDAEVLVLDDLGIGPNSAYSRQLIQEVLDGRDSADRAGLVITSQYSLGDLADRLMDDTITSRIVGMCQVFEIQGRDYRLYARGAAKK